MLEFSDIRPDQSRRAGPLSLTCKEKAVLVILHRYMIKKGGLFTKFSKSMKTVKYFLNTKIYIVILHGGTKKLWKVFQTLTYKHAG